MILGLAAQHSSDFRAKSLQTHSQLPTWDYAHMRFCVSVGISGFTQLHCDAVILGLYDMYCSYTVAMEIYNPIWLGVCVSGSLYG